MKKRFLSLAIVCTMVFSLSLISSASVNGTVSGTYVGYCSSQVGFEINSVAMTSGTRYCYNALHNLTYDNGSDYNFNVATYTSNGMIIKNRVYTTRTGSNRTRYTLNSSTNVQTGVENLVSNDRCKADVRWDYNN